MAQIKQHMYQHLRSAKDWLTKAEEAFAKQHDVRAELDLMLAQAELQHAKEVNRSRQWRYKYILLRHGVALTLAMFMAVTMGGVYWWTTRPVVAPVPLTVQPKSPVELAPKTQMVVTPQVPPVATPAEVQVQVPVQQIVKEQEMQKPSKVVQSSQVEQSHAQVPVVLSENEVQKLVRAAGKSLRGQ